MSRLKSTEREIVARHSTNPWHLWRWAVDRAHDKWFERKFRIASSQRLSSSEIGIDTPGYYEYQPVSYTDFRRLLKHVSIRSQHDVFLDIGSGMGRALCLAAVHPFRRVIGVEISPRLNVIAEQNISRARPKLRCQDIQIVAGDAAAYVVPGDVTVVFFFTPFNNETLVKVMENVAKSLREHPRPLQILYYCSADHPEFLRPLNHCPWLMLKSDLILPTGRVGKIYANTMWT